MKDVRYYKREFEGNRFPYERADRFRLDIKKLGMDGNLTFLDKFRLLVTEIGNAMGYVSAPTKYGNAPQIWRRAPNMATRPKYGDAPQIWRRARQIWRRAPNMATRPKYGGPPR